MTTDTPIDRPLDSVRVLFSEMIDYAGLFPPAQLTMAEAVINFAAYRNSNYSWMLGRFIVPAARLGEFWESADEFVSRGSGEPWRLSVLAGEDINETLRIVNDFNAKHSSRVVIDCLEVKASTVSKIDNTVEGLPGGVVAYFEVSMKDGFGELVAELALKGQRAKIRTGGVTHELFPSSHEIVRFVRTCMAANVPFKATAGLHHPIRCFRPLTYAADAPMGTMHGFLNMLLMTGFAREGFRPNILEDVMEDEFEEVFAFAPNAVSWRNDHVLDLAQITRLRTKGMNSFGSCSFDEPIADLRALGLL